jgi:hypothetical protein
VVKIFQAKCCDEEVCVPCVELEDLCSWSIYESILGFTFNGSFDALNLSGCNKSGCVCERADNVVIDGYAVLLSDWTNWIPIINCGPCRDCVTGDRPLPCPDDILTGGVICPPDYPNYTTVEKASKNGAKWKFFYSKGVQVCVTAFYLPDNKVKYTATVFYKIASTRSIAYGTRTKWRVRELRCVYDTILSEVVNNDGSVDIPEPLDPCADALTPEFDLSECPSFEPDPPPDPCEGGYPQNVCISPCVIWNGTECESVSGCSTIYTSTSVNCCDGDGFGCVGSFFGQEGVLSYTSDEYDCDDVPSSIPLNLVSPASPPSFELSHECDPEWTNSVATVYFNFPSSLTLTTSTSCP